MGWIFSAFLTFYIIILITRKCVCECVLVCVCVCVCAGKRGFSARGAWKSRLCTVWKSRLSGVSEADPLPDYDCPYSQAPTNTILNR